MYNFMLKILMKVNDFRLVILMKVIYSIDVKKIWKLSTILIKFYDLI